MFALVLAALLDMIEVMLELDGAPIDEKLALTVLDALKETAVEKLALTVLNVAEKAAFEAALELKDVGLESVTLGEEPALDGLNTAEEPTLDLEAATPEDEPALAGPETVEATIELEVGVPTDDVLDRTASLTLAATDEDMLLWDTPEVEDLVLEADKDGLMEADD